jgi:hypothetical protein
MILGSQQPLHKRLTQRQRRSKQVMVDLWVALLLLLLLLGLGVAWTGDSEIGLACLR